MLIEFHNDKIYVSYDPKKLHNFLVQNGFELAKKFKFPFTTWEDRFYINKKNLIYIFVRTICLPKAKIFGKYFVRKLSILSNTFNRFLLNGI